MLRSVRADQADVFISSRSIIYYRLVLCLFVHNYIDSKIQTLVNIADVDSSTKFIKSTRRSSSWRPRWRKPNRRWSSWFRSGHRSKSTWASRTTVSRSIASCAWVFASHTTWLHVSAPTAAPTCDRVTSYSYRRDVIINILSMYLYVRECIDGWSRNMVADCVVAPPIVSVIDNLIDPIGFRPFSYCNAFDEAQAYNIREWLL